MKKLLLILLALLAVFITSCSLPTDDGNGSEDLESEEIVEYIFTRIQEMNPDFDIPDFTSRATLSMPEELDSWDAEEEKAELEEMIADINALATDPYGRHSEGTRHPRSTVITEYEELPGITTPAYSTCTYRWIENGELRVTWIDLHTMESSDEETVFTWLVQIFHEDIDEEGNFSDPYLILRDQYTATHYPTTLIETEWATMSYADNGAGAQYVWAEYCDTYDPIEKLYTNTSAVNLWDFSLGYPHASIRMISEKPDTEELFDYPPVHIEIYNWGVNTNVEFLHIDLYIDVETGEWSYTIYDEYGVVQESEHS